MKFVLSSYGSRGEVEPCAAVGRELVHRGHKVHIAVAPDLVGLAESAGLMAVACGPDSWLPLQVVRDLGTFRNFWAVHRLIRCGRELWELFTRCWAETTVTLRSLAEGAHLLLTGPIGEWVSANIAEYYGIPLATLHHFPIRVNGQVLPNCPAPLTRATMRVSEWLTWPVLWKKLEDAQRRELGLTRATYPSSRRIAERGWLEIQAYDEACFPGLAAEWAEFHDQRPFVGALTLELPTDGDNEVAAWIAAGKPPIYFGFGSIPVKSAADTLAMISEACAQLGERALICAGGTDFSHVPPFEHIKVVGLVNYAAVFPACRAVVHHGGAGTTAACLRAGIPQLILWMLPDQTRWAAVIKRLKVGSGRPFSQTTWKSLIRDLRTITAPQYVARAREFATRMTKPSESVAIAADHVENLARLRRVG
jgi:UDP:flavonoid glycosyltransferase YjiC (YdhE family)